MNDISVGRIEMVPLNSIYVDDRTREEMGDLEGLEANMKESGLISPLAVIDKDSEGNYKLLAGERRYTILKRNEVANVPVRIYGIELTEIEMKIIEKSENFFRKDMEFWELDKLTLEITRLQQELKGVKSPGPTDSGWSLEDTGEMIGGVSKGTVSQSIKRAELRETFPELFEGCKSASDATKVIKKMDEAIIKEALAESIKSKKGDKTITQLANAFIIKNFFEGIKEIPDGVFHLVEIDPPYAIDLKKVKKTEGESQYQLDDYNEVPKNAYMDGGSEPDSDFDSQWLGMNEVFRECYRTMADHSWLICWFGMEPWFEVIFQAMMNAGFNSTRICGIWTKRTGQTKHPETRLANTYETFFYAWKGKPAMNKSGKGNTFDFPPVPPQSKNHPTERPIELIQEIYDTFAFPGSRVLIPFLGSGSGLLAAHMLDLTAMGFELSKGYKDSFLVRANNLLGGKTW